ncbi:CDP-alcohol phosphatidyltransferase [Aureobasidium pullulans]|uniref:CDP-alcohol phosphatidyltransferase n=1 Tax=Aureobasidium pullulans TaxID=5580 RepID=A0A4S8XVU3_AURPU|nr:CDP-alcohol phosphatidyltransferase [Aureobasidium pullulans]
MVTLLGFFCILSNVILMLIYDPGLTGLAPSWVYYSYALGIWSYSTMDNIDGKQARRTGTSSPLGELFDHGIDSLNCTLASLLETSAMGLGSTRLGALTALIPTLPMFFSTWETYHTHTLFLGYFNGPTEGLIIAALIMILSGYYGPTLWTSPLESLFGHEQFLGKTSFLDLWGPILLLGLCLAHIPDCVNNVYQARRGRSQPLIPTLLEWAPIFIFTGSLCAWLGSPYSHLLKDNHLSLLCFTLSPAFGRMTTKIILAHLTRQDFPMWTVMLAPLITGSVLVNLPYIGLPGLSATTELWFLRGYFAFATIVYARWAVYVCNSICNYLGINCLTIPEDKWLALKSGAPPNQRPEATRLASGSVRMKGGANGKFA